MARNIAVALPLSRRCRRTDFIVLAMLTMILVGAGGVAQALETCPSRAISSCPCGIKSEGTYILSNSLTLSTPGDCIHISASNVTLDLGGFTITGQPGQSSTLSGIGIWILPGTSGVSVIGTGSTSTSANAISQFQIGIEVDGANAAVEDVEADYNQAGIKFNAPGAFGSNLTAQFNEKNGIAALPSAVAPYLTNLFADANQGSGVKLNGTKGGFLAVVEASSNAGYGVWLSGASYNTLADFTLSKNTWAGVYLGCYKYGELGKACPAGSHQSSDNIITSVSTDPSNVSAGVGTPSYGIAINVGNSYNRVIGVTASNSPTDDAIDENANCGTDLWLNNTFTLKSPTGCIQ